MPQHKQLLSSVHRTTTTTAAETAVATAAATKHNMLILSRQLFVIFLSFQYPDRQWDLFFCEWLLLVGWKFYILFHYLSLFLSLLRSLSLILLIIMHRKIARKNRNDRKTNREVVSCRLQQWNSKQKLSLKLTHHRHNHIVRTLTGWLWFCVLCDIYQYIYTYKYSYKNIRAK